MLFVTNALLMINHDNKEVTNVSKTGDVGLV